MTLHAIRAAALAQDERWIAPDRRPVVPAPERVDHFGHRMGVTPNAQEKEGQA